jgi:hypothetical protein
MKHFVIFVNEISERILFQQQQHKNDEISRKKKRKNCQVDNRKLRLYLTCSSFMMKLLYYNMTVNKK